MPATLTAPGSSVLTVTTQITTSTRTYPLTVTATGAGLSRSVTVPLTVTKASLRDVIASLDGPRKAVADSRDYLLSNFGEPEPGWLPVGATV